MAEAVGVDRRSFLAALPALVGAAGLFLSCREGAAPTEPLDRLAGELAPGDRGLALAEKALGRIGRRREGAAALDPRELRESLARELLAGLEPGAGPEDVRRHLDRRAREELAAGRTAELDGWILAETELLLLAYAALLSAPAAGSRPGR